MKRFFLITLTNGKEYEFDFEKVFDRMTYIAISAGGIKPNNQNLLKATAALANEGFMEPGTDERPKWICSSQIKHVEIVFEAPKMKVETLTQ